MNNKQEFLELGILIYLMNENIWLSLRESLQLEIAKTRGLKKGEDILAKLRESVEWESFTGPAEIDDATIEEVRHAVHKKLENYKKYGNFNL